MENDSPIMFHHSPVKLSIVELDMGHFSRISISMAMNYKRETIKKCQADGWTRIELIETLIEILISGEDAWDFD